MIKINTVRLSRIAVLILMLALLTPWPIGAMRAEQKSNDAYVVMISVDGLAPDYYTKADRYGLKIPNIRALCKEGSYAEGSETVYPSLTYPSHTTLVTGVRPARHGILSNRIWQDPTTQHGEDWYWYAREIKTPTLWSEAHKAGLKTAAVGWPVTVGAEIDYQIPEFWQAGLYETSLKASLEHSVGLPKEILATLPDPKTGKLADEVRASAAEAIINNYKPNLLLLHLVGLDFVEHDFGPFTPEAFSKLEQIDQYIGRVIAAVKAAGIAEQTTFLIVSDHGFMKAGKEYNPGVVLAKEGLITVSKNGRVSDWQAMVYGRGGSTAIMPKNKQDRAVEKRVVEIFEAIAGKPNSPIYRVVKREELDKLGANPDAICFLDAAPGYIMGNQLTGDAITKSKDKGTHGYLPSRAEMFASFIACGRGVRAGVREPFTKNVHVAPTVAALLGFAIPNAEGRPMREILTVTIPKAPAQTPGARPSVPDQVNTK